MCRQNDNQRNDLMVLKDAMVNNLILPKTSYMPKTFTCFRTQGGVKYFPSKGGLVSRENRYSFALIDLPLLLRDTFKPCARSCYHAS